MDRSRPTLERKPPALLFLGHYYGTLAAARCLGERGIPVTLADGQRWARASVSRFITARVTPPRFADVDRFLAWLLDYGKAHPGAVLFPASDELAWVFALHQAELAKDFIPYTPAQEVVSSILDKWRLTQACLNAGIEVPATWCPNGEAEVERLAREIRGVVMIKPRSQVLLASGSKGVKVDRPSDLPRAYRDYLAENPPADALSKLDPTLGRPLVQEFRPEAAGGIYNLAGFVDRTQERVVVRASRKILQRPRRLGIGLCFESALLDPKLEGAVLSLCRELGYFGIFEIEMIEADGRHLLIDFNPRPYSQMAFEIARGVPLPLLAYLDATRQTAALDAEVADAREEPPDAATAYTHTLLLSLVIAGQAAMRPFGGRMIEPWPSWLRRHRLRDAAFDRKDPLPAVLDAIAHVEHFVKHPRSFVRSLLR